MSAASTPNGEYLAIFGSLKPPESCENILTDCSLPSQKVVAVGSPCPSPFVPPELWNQQIVMTARNLQAAKILLGVMSSHVEAVDEQWYALPPPPPYPVQVLLSVHLPTPLLANGHEALLQRGVLEGQGRGRQRPLPRLGQSGHRYDSRHVRDSDARKYPLLNSKDKNTPGRLLRQNIRNLLAAVEGIPRSFPRCPPPVGWPSSSPSRPHSDCQMSRPRSVPLAGNVPSSRWPASSEFPWLIYTG